MTSVRDILNQFSDKLAKPLTSAEAMLLLGKARWEGLGNSISLTEERKEILKYLAGSDKFISQKEVSELFQKAQSNVSGYYFKPLIHEGVIEEKEKRDRTPYYGLTERYLPLKWVVAAQKDVSREMSIQVEQLARGI